MAGNKKAPAMKGKPKTTVVYKDDLEDESDEFEPEEEDSSEEWQATSYSFCTKYCVEYCVIPASHLSLLACFPTVRASTDADRLSGCVPHGRIMPGLFNASAV